MNTATNRTAPDALATRARRVLAADAYLPGRAHFAAILAELVFHAVVENVARWSAGNGRGTMLHLAACLYRVAGNDARAEGCRMLGASIIGTWFDGGCRDTVSTPSVGVRQ